MSTTTGSKSANGAPARLSITQMLGLMRVEFQRARAQRTHLCCLMVAAPEGQSTQAAYEVLKQASRERAVFGMALCANQRIMAIFPNATQEALEGLAQAMQSRDAQLRLGAAHNQLAETQASFEGLVERAGRALHQTESGAARYVMWRAAESEVEGLRADLAIAQASFQAASEESAELAGIERAALLEKLDGLFDNLASTPELARLRQQVLALAAAELGEERQKAVAHHQRQIEMLERRIAKLNAAMGVTEEQLLAALANRTMDAGVASLYRTVQGLSTTDSNREQKKAMMATIFEQNLSFQKRAAEKQA